MDVAKIKLEVDSAESRTEGGSPPLHEQYRPSRWEDIVGQDDAIRKLMVVRRRGFGGRAFWISGKSSSGKTTIAWMIARELADDFNIVEVEAGTEFAPAIQEHERSMQTYGMGEKTGRVIIFNEAHGMSQGTVRQLLVTLERIPRHVAWVFTTTADGVQQKLFKDATDAEALVSRCVPVHLQSTGLTEAFACRAKWIAQQEGLDGQPIERYQALARDCNNNLRAMLSRIEIGEMLLASPQTNPKRKTKCV